MRRRRVQLGEPIGAPSVLDGVIPPTLGETLGELQAVAQLGATLHELGQRRRAEREGVIELEEVTPGVFAMPRDRARARARAANGKLGRFQALVNDFDHLARAIHGNRR